MAAEVFRFVSRSRTCREKREKGKEWWRREGGEGLGFLRGSEGNQKIRRRGSRGSGWRGPWKGVTHLAWYKERAFPARSRKVRCPVAEKGVDPGETATHFYFCFSKDQKEER
jgi:hypothetical protein